MTRLFAILSAFLFFAIPARAADWTDTWFNSVTVGGPASFEGQKRGYLTGGQISGRLHMGTDNLVTVSLPRMRASCGGIDLFAGGVSFLDPEYLVSKLENILQAAPAMAFSMALKTHCEMCEDIMAKLEQTSTFLNSIQVNDCRMANQVARAITGDDPDLYGNILMEATGHRSLKDALEKNYQGAKERVDAAGGLAPHDLKAEVASCPAPVRELFADGSVIEHAASRVGMPEVADLIRGYVGDVFISWPTGQTAPIVRDIDSCPTIDRFTAEDFLEGRALERPATGAACTPNSTISVIARVNTTMTAIAGKIETGAALAADEVDFVNQSALPVWSILRSAVYRGTTPETIAASEYPVAAALAYRIFDDLLRNTEYLLDKAIADASTMGVDGSVTATEGCNLELYAPARAKIERLREELIDARRMALASYRTVIEMQANNAIQLRSTDDDVGRNVSDFAGTVRDR